MFGASTSPDTKKKGIRDMAEGRHKQHWLFKERAAISSEYC